MDTVQATIVDARLARRNSLGTIVAKPRMQALQLGANHSLVWLIEPSQLEDLELALRAHPAGSNERIVLSDCGSNYFEKVSQLINQFECTLAVGDQLMVLSYSREVVDFACQWKGVAVVRGVALTHYRTSNSQSNAAAPPSAETIPPVQAEDIRTGWEAILRLLSQWVSPSANAIVCKFLERRSKFGESLSWDEMTRHGIVKQLECELGTDERTGRHDASEKNAQKFFNRLMGASALLNQTSERIDAEDQSETIASVDLQFRELLLEWIMLSIARGDPEHFGNGDYSSVKRLEAAVDRLLIQRQIAEVSTSLLDSRWSLGYGAGEGE